MMAMKRELRSKKAWSGGDNDLTIWSKGEKVRWLALLAGRDPVAVPFSGWGLGL